MRALDRKMFRDLWAMKGQALAITVVLTCGVATFILSLGVRTSLELTLRSYYERYHFAEVFARVKRAPNVFRERIEEIPGVAQLQTRIVIDVTLDIPDMREPAVGRLISIPDRTVVGTEGGPVRGDRLNRLHLRRGRYIEPGRDGEVLVSEAFAKEHGFNPGDSVWAVINGKKQRLRIVGVALSPEFVFPIREGELLPDAKRFGVFWMGYTELAAAYDMQEAFNDIALTLMPGASEEEVIRRLDLITDEYGGFGAFGRRDQISHRFIQTEIDNLKSMALIAPIIFLCVSAFLLNVVLSRKVAMQREQIAALKAFGYTHWEVGLHYLKFVFVLVFLAMIFGTALGVAMGRYITGLYAKFYSFPVFEYRLEPSVFGTVLLVASIAATAGTLNAVRRAVRLPPAEAMRPEPPASYRVSFVERLGLRRFLPMTLRMVIRNLGKAPVKTLFSAIGLALASAVLVVGNFIEDTINYVIQEQFFATQRQDMTVTFIEPTNKKALYELEHLPGVIQAEGFRAVGTRFRHRHISRRVGIQGIESERTLQRLLDDSKNDIPVPPEGLLISAKLAEVLKVHPGDEVRVEVLEGERPVRDVVVANLINDYAGMNAYMHIDALHRLMREGDSISGAYLLVDSNQEDELYHRLKNAPQVAGVSVKRAAVQSFNQTIAENLMIIKTVYAVFAIVIAVGVVYNNARVSLSERSRELATLRVLGFSRVEISIILLGEMAVLVLVALPVGLVMGYGLASLITSTLGTEDQRFPLYIESSTYAMTALVVLGAAVISGLIVRRQLDRLDLVAVLKTKEYRVVAAPGGGRGAPGLPPGGGGYNKR